MGHFGKIVPAGTTRDGLMQSPSLASATCPHIVFSNVFGARRVADLLSYVGEREADFQPALVRNRNTGDYRVDREVRSSLCLGDLGPFKAPFEEFARDISVSSLERLGFRETVAPETFQIVAFRDGDRFRAHIDTDTVRVRILSCVYYFARTPRGFSGGELRLHGLPALSAANAPGFVDIAPATDTMVVFPSWLRHEVLPVQVPSGLWADGRFTLNCWLHRAAA